MTASESNSEKLATDLKRVVHDSEELLRDSAEAAGQKAHELRARLTRAVESAKAGCLRLEEKAKHGAQATDRVIRDHPYQSLGIAFGLGALIGALIARKR
jgi:ElaB/YqjD/DUF883 family membrane-anchored ribosome-binding protein